MRTLMKTMDVEDFIDGVVSEDDGLIRPDEEVFLLADDNWR